MITLTGIFDYIEWDIDKEKERNRKNAEKILRRSPDEEGLKEVLDDVQSLMDSEIYEKVYEASNLEEAAKVLQENGDFSLLSAEYLLEHYRQNRYAASVLKDPPVYSPSLFTDTIISTHFISITGIIGLINYAYKQSKISLRDVDKERSILEHVMCLLDDFDKPIKIQPPDEEFYKKLRKIKWDKQGKKLFLKIRDIFYDIKDVRWGGKSSDYDTTEYFAVMFLAACNAVNHTRDKILPEDVVVAYRTYL
ncbi:MAG: hypothetical protein PQ964_02170 [Methanobacteriaceae archaeon]